MTWGNVARETTLSPFPPHNCPAVIAGISNEAEPSPRGGHFGCFNLARLHFMFQRYCASPFGRVGGRESSSPTGPMALPCVRGTRCCPGVVAARSPFQWPSCSNYHRVSDGLCRVWWIASPVHCNKYHSFLTTSVVRPWHSPPSQPHHPPGTGSLHAVSLHTR